MVTTTTPMTMLTASSRRLPFLSIVITFVVMVSQSLIFASILSLLHDVVFGGLFR